MSHITLAQQGLAAAEAKDWDTAVTKLSTALQESLNPAWLITRSKALVNKGRYDEALDDANLAWHAAYDRNKRPFMVQAQYRRAVAYLRLKQYANADACCFYAMGLVKGSPASPKEDSAHPWIGEDGTWKMTLEGAKKEAADEPMNQKDHAATSSTPEGVKEWRLASSLRMQSLGAMERLPADDLGRKITTSQKPEKKDLQKLTKDISLPAPEKTAVSATPTASKENITAQPVPTTKPIPSSDAPLRLQDYQNNTHMNVSVFSKGVDKGKLQVDFQPTSVVMNPLVYPDGTERSFSLDLWSNIDVTASKYTVTPNKVELSLAKATPGKWKALRSDSPAKETDTASAGKATVEPSQSIESPAVAQPQPSQASADITSSADPNSENPAKASGPAYPTSSKKGPTNWDKIATEQEEEDEGGDVNGFFKKIFKTGTAEQQRAMVKSFTESNGTSLSTDWNDVQARKVDTVPPEGLEAKKWGA